MNIKDLLKKMATEDPDLVANLEPCKDDAACILYRGTEYKGSFVTVHKCADTGEFYGYISCYQSPFDHRYVRGSGFKMDPATGIFRGVLDEKEPCTGDKAFTHYHGEKYVGVLRLRGDRALGYIEPADPEKNWGWHPTEVTRGLSVGYDESIVWNAELQMYHAPADGD